MQTKILVLVFIIFNVVGTVFPDKCQKNTKSFFNMLQKDIDYTSAKITGSQLKTLAPQIEGNISLYY